jgi:tRNA-2-methylthio-N6-dimethylallyladenosine synthase
MAKQYHIWTIGCQMNEADSRRLAQQLEFVGYEPARETDAADVVVLNTCVVRQQAEDRAASRLSSLGALKSRGRPDMVIGLMGCMVGMREAPALRERFPFVDVFMAPSDTAPLLDFLDRKGHLADLREQDLRTRSLRDAVMDEDLPLPADERGSAVTAHVPVVLGCSHACAFCVIPYRRGAERSRPMADVVNEARSLARQGVREVTLLGQIVDRYGTDLGGGASLSRLLREIARIEELDRIRFLTSHPNYMTEEILETVAEVGQVCPQIEVPAQAGNNDVLAAMRRGYTHEQYRGLVERIRTTVPDAAIHTDVIVGFPGETEARFMDTYALLKDLRFDKVHIFQYSVRPKTIASRRLADDVPEEEKRRRWQALEDLQRGILDDKNAALRGQVVQVLVEGQYKGKWRGRTRHGKVVFFEDPAGRVGQLVDVVPDWTGPYTLIGRAAQHKTSHVFAAAPN